MLYRLSISVPKNMGIFWTKNSFKNHAMSQPHNNPPLHVQKGRNFLCKNRLKIGRSNYIKNLAEKSCFFKAYRRLSLKIYAKESSLCGAISYVFHFRKSPGQSSPFTQLFAISKWVLSKIAYTKMPHTHSAIFVEIFQKCGIMIL